MLLNIQFEEAAELMWEMHQAIPKGEHDHFSARVDKISSQLSHPDLGGAIILSVSCNRAGQSAQRSPRSVVFPLEGAKIT